MKERELRLYTNCSICHKPIGHTGLPCFSRVTIERIGIRMAPVQRQTGLAMLLGGSAALAQVMGADEEMTESIGGVTTLSICEACYLQPIMPAQLAELEDVLAEPEKASG